MSGSQVYKSLKEMIGTGIGCDSLGDEEIENEEYSEALALRQIARRDAIRAAQRLWGVPEWP